ncbi:MAG: hypothetical protein QM696_06140 [Steroidobacteraceae bacterium]
MSTKQLSRRVIFGVSLAVLLSACAGTSQKATTDTGFTIAVIPDTQNYVNYKRQKADGFPFDASEQFIAQFRYIAANVESAGGDIAFVAGLGDNWEHQSKLIDPEHEARGFRRIPNPLLDREMVPTEKVRTVEMPKVLEAWRLIDGKVPFGVVPGNHDYDAMWPDSHFPPKAQVDLSDLSSIGGMHSGGLDNWRSVFGADQEFFKGKPWYVASHDGGADSAQIFEAGGYRFLHIGLQFDAPNASLEWAAQIVARYPGMPTIVSLHDYLNTDGERLPNPMIDNAAADPLDNSPQMIWDKFISQHEQIFLVLCGHEHGQAKRVDVNKAGTKVWQVLADYQDRGQTAKEHGVTSPYPQFPVGIGDGWLRLMTFDMAAKVPTITVKTYSTHYRKFSGETAEYAAWYRDHEQPRMTDAEFHAADDYVIQLADFRARFDKRRK